MSQREENRSATSRSENSSNALPPKAAEAVNTPASENALDAAFKSAQTAFTSPDAFVDVHGMASSGESNLNRGSPAFNLHGSLHTVPAARSAVSGIPPQSANPTVSHDRHLYPHPAPQPPLIVAETSQHPTISSVNVRSITSPTAVPEVGVNNAHSGPLVDFNFANSTRSLRELQASARKCMVGLKFEVMAESPALDPVLVRLVIRQNGGSIGNTYAYSDRSQCDYVVLGLNAEPSPVAAIYLEYARSKQIGILNEDGLCNLIQSLQANVTPTAAQLGTLATGHNSSSGALQSSRPSSVTQPGPSSTGFDASSKVVATLNELSQFNTDCLYGLSFIVIGERPALNAGRMKDIIWNNCGQVHHDGLLADYVIVGLNAKPSPDNLSVFKIVQSKNIKVLYEQDFCDLFLAMLRKCTSQAGGAEVQSHSVGRDSLAPIPAASSGSTTAASNEQVIAPSIDNSTRPVTTGGSSDPENTKRKRMDSNPDLLTDTRPTKRALVAQSFSEPTSSYGSASESASEDEIFSVEENPDSEDLHGGSRADSDEDPEEMYGRPEPKIDEDFPPSEKGYLVQITLDLPKINPPVKRILRVPVHTNFLTLSRIINIAYGWSGQHLWYFSVNELPHPSWSQQRAKTMKRYVTDMDSIMKIMPKVTDAEKQWELRPRRLRQADKLTLEDIWGMDTQQHAVRGREIKYVYDLGDNWPHTITFLGNAADELRSAMRLAPGKKVWCISGEGRSWPEHFRGDTGEWEVWKGRTNMHQWDIEKVNRQLGQKIC